jgi:transcriptional regulator with XRE-family HTH domain
MVTGAAVDHAVGRRLRLFRLLANVAIGDLARKLRIEAEHIIEFEAGRVRPQPNQLAELAELLQIRLSWLFIGLEDDALELAMANEIEAALGNQTDEDLDFIRCASELFESYRACSAIDEVTLLVAARARKLLAQRVVPRSEEKVPRETL